MEKISKGKLVSPYFCLLRCIPFAPCGTVGVLCPEKETGPITAQTRGQRMEHEESQGAGTQRWTQVRHLGDTFLQGKFNILGNLGISSSTNPPQTYPWGFTAASWDLDLCHLPLQRCLGAPQLPSCSPSSRPVGSRGHLECCPLRSGTSGVSSFHRVGGAQGALPHSELNIWWNRHPWKFSKRLCM